MKYYRIIKNRDIILVDRNIKKGNIRYKQFPEDIMPKIHINLEPDIHELVKQKAKEINYSVQEFVEKSIVSDTQAYKYFNQSSFIPLITDISKQMLNI